MRFLALLALAAALGCGGESADPKCEFGDCNWGPDRPEQWCARPDHQCYAEDAPGYTP